jgi:hypothetical protein
MSFDLKSTKTYRDNQEETEEVEDYYEENISNNGVFLSWRGKEHEDFNVKPKVLLIFTIILLAIIGYAVYSNSPVMAIAFILIGLVGYIHLKKEPEVINFMLTVEGIAAGNEFYDYDNINSFWIFYNPPLDKKLSLHMKGRMVPFIHIPIHNQDPVKIREILTQFVPEVKQQKTLLDTFDFFLH